jgi:hypothetical protein
MDEGALLPTSRSPPAEYGPAPLLVFNDEHEGEAGEACIARMLEGHRRVGYGGVFLHPRPGLMTEYLSARWFELMRHAVEECLRLGLVPCLYDENSYPSGFAGGHVPGRVSETSPPRHSRASSTIFSNSTSSEDPAGIRVEPGVRAADRLCYGGDKVGAGGVQGHLPAGYLLLSSKTTSGLTGLARSSPLA